MKAWTTALLFGLLVSSPRARAEPDAGDTSALRYVEAGMPAAGRTWTSQDYAAAAGVLATMLPEQLPRVDTPHFARIVNQENLSLAYPSTDSALGEVLGISKNMSAINRIYLRAFSGGQPLYAEILGLTGVTLRLGARQWALTDALLQEHPEWMDDPVRMQGLAQVRSGAATMLSGGLMLIESHGDSPDVPMISFIGEMNQVLAVLLPRLDAEVQADLRRKIAAIHARMPEDAVRDAFAPATRL